jgi:hypothetical protein
MAESAAPFVGVKMAEISPHDAMIDDATIRTNETSIKAVRRPLNQNFSP